MLGIYNAYFMVMPRVIVENISGERIKLIEVTLPNNRLVFDAIEQGNIYEIYYSLNQNDGVYHYRVVFKDGKEKTGECGNISAYELGKKYRFTLRVDRFVTCDGQNI